MKKTRSGMPRIDTGAGALCDMVVNEDTAVVELKDVATNPSPQIAAAAAAGDDLGCGAPRMDLWPLFLLFLNFGCNAFGGPTAQIAMQKQALVTEGRWVSLKRFNRVYAIYQALPGPEATEFCCYFGMLSRGRVGAVLGGLGFILPGFVLMLTLSWAYGAFDLYEEPVFQRSFYAVRAAVPALVVKSVQGIANGALTRDGATDGAFDTVLVACCFVGVFMTLLNTPFFLSIVFTGLANTARTYAEKAWGVRRGTHVGCAVLFAGLAANIAVSAVHGRPSDLVAGAGLQAGGRALSCFVTGLLAGLLTFGGAYTAIPFVYSSCVVATAWLTQSEFLDAIALVNCLPTPTVMFVTFVGYRAGGLSGALLMTLGIFLPAFSFTLVGHAYFEKVVDEPRLHAFLDGLTAGVIGLIVCTCWTLIRDGVQGRDMDAVVFGIAMLAVYGVLWGKHKFTPIFVVVLAALAGQELYRDGV